MSTSRISGFKDLSVDQRRRQAAESAGLAAAASMCSSREPVLSLDQADHMIENVVGVLGVPVGVATNFIVNGTRRPRADGDRGAVRRRRAPATRADDPRPRRLPHLRAPTRSCRPRCRSLDVADPAGRPAAPARGTRDELIELANAQDPALVELRRRRP